MTEQDFFWFINLRIFVAVTNWIIIIREERHQDWKNSESLGEHKWKHFIFCLQFMLTFIGMDSQKHSTWDHHEKFTNLRASSKVAHDRSKPAIKKFEWHSPSIVARNFCIC